MLTEEKLQPAEKSVQADNLHSGGNSGRREKLGMVIQAELWAAVLFLAAAALALFVGDRPGEAIAVAVSLLVALVCVGIAERQNREVIGLDRADFRRLMFSVYDGKFFENGLRMPLAMRFAPLALGALSTLVCLVRALFGGVGDYGTGLSVLAIFCASATLGVELPAVIAAANGVIALKQRDIEVESPEKLGCAARAKCVLADKSVFFASKGTESGGVYIRGKAYGVSEMSFRDVYPMLAAIYACDDGALSAAFGFRQSIADGLFRALRTNRLEHSELFGFRVEDFLPYDPSLGYARALCYISSNDGLEGIERTYFVGKPDSIVPYVKWELDEFGHRPLADADIRHIRLHLRQTYSAGREVIAVAARVGDGDGLVLIGFLHVNCIISEAARESVSELKNIGVEPVYVSEENENCAFYHARELGVARDMSQVLTGSRVERFRPENLVRAARHARLCAEAEAEHRRVLTDVLAEDRVVMSASKSGDDELLSGADIRVTSPGGAYGTDFIGRNCSIEDVSLVARIARSVCAAARRAEYQLFCAPVCAALLCFLTMLIYGKVPFGAAAVVILTSVLPLPQMLMTAKMDVRSAKGLMPAFLFGNSEPSDTPIKAGFGLAVWNIVSCIVTAVFACYIYGAYSSVEGVGTAGASAAAFLMTGAYALVNGIVCRVWGKSVLSLKDENGGVKFIVVTLLSLAVIFAAMQLEAAAGVFGMAVLAYKRLPFTLLPAMVIFLAYEIGGAINRRRRSHEDK